MIRLMLQLFSQSCLHAQLNVSQVMSPSENFSKDVVCSGSHNGSRKFHGERGGVSLNTLLLKSGIYRSCDCEFVRETVNIIQRIMSVF